MSAKGQRLKLRLFLEGVEVPIIAAQIQTAPNSPAVCALQIPPVSEVTRLLPRTVVHLYFLDFYAGASPFLSFRSGSTNGKLEPTTYERTLKEEAAKLEQETSLDNVASNYLNDQYKLLFTGEVIGFQWTKNANNRCVVLQCQDFSNYWDYAYQWNNTDLFGPGMKALFSGGATNLFTDFLEEEGSVIARIVQTKSVNYPKLEGLLGGIVHLLEAIGGSYYAPDEKGRKTKFAGQNIFFSLAELRLHITQMITALPDDPTAHRLFNSGGYGSLLGRTLGNLGAQVSIRQAINALMGVIFHETYAQPCPLYVPGTEGTVSGYVRKKVKADPSLSFIAFDALSLISSIEAIKESVNASSPVDSKTGSSLKVALLTRVGEAKKFCKTTSQKIKVKNIPSALSFYNTALSLLGTAETKIKSLWKASAFHLGNSDIIKDLDSAIEQMQKVSELEVNVTPQKVAVPARLNQQIFRPDVWFSAPPRCNVLFPENYYQLNYQRSFLQEPTRLLLKTNDEFFGEDELFDKFFFAPKSFTLKKQQANLQALLSNDLLDHELFTGILPVFEKMGELNIFAARSGTLKGKSAGIGLAQRSTNFLYFKYRFAARQMQVSCRFNPYIANGFPGLIIDKYVDTDVLQRYNDLLRNEGRPTRDINKLLGTHFLGNFTEVSHTVDQQQGKTEISCSYPRQPDEGVEFLGALEADVPIVQKRFENDALRSTDIASLDPPRLNGVGPFFGQITSIQEVTDIYAPRYGETTPQGDSLPLFLGGRRTGTGEAKASVPIGITQTALEYGPVVAQLIGDPERPVTFRAFRVLEEVPRYRKEKVELPAEEYIRPGWYGEIWHPSNIGKAYNHFFQTGSITDKQQIGDADGASMGDVSQDAEDALANAASGVEFEDPRRNAPALFTLDEGSSIEQAVAFLVLTYSYIRTGDLDIEEFLRAYQWRPVASLVDLFGTSDLTLSEDGTEVIQGIEGFHSRAFGDFENLFGLVTPDIESITGIKRGSNVAKKGDVRKRRRDAVREIVAALLFSRAILG